MTLRSRILLQAALFFGSMHCLSAADAPDPAGRPKHFEEGKANMFAVWWDDDGTWHMRATNKKPGPKDKNKDTKAVFTGTVSVKGDILVANYQGLELADKAKDADWIFPHKTKQGFDFRFNGTGKVVGMNFKVGSKAESVTFKLIMNGDDDPKKVFIGKDGKHPEKGEFTLAIPPNSPTLQSPKK